MEKMGCAIQIPAGYVEEKQQNKKLYSTHANAVAVSSLSIRTA
jgi:hypothetical protein